MIDNRARRIVKSVLDSAPMGVDAPRPQQLTPEAIKMISERFPELVNGWPDQRTHVVRDYITNLLNAAHMNPETTQEASLILVASMLEDAAGEFEERPGGKKDMWRKGGFGKPKLHKNDFTGQRPGEAHAAEAEGAEEAEGAAKAGKIKPANQSTSRFNWKPKA